MAHTALPPVAHICISKRSTRFCLVGMRLIPANGDKTKDGADETQKRTPKDHPVQYQ
ncbi:hypothetical protein H634G_11515 [Metarhizium anisopliae BRIP 53293]|uniref:Uncharacterized protein n=1 Tax=Metarhizium anisopliae BRIP 53293 TaxID=1291518 RepID=A0A0D9NHB8_METAN|nr:hypothetical protein H634G_11515 [Metarhizium anisopliae BRIP 53293]KJK84700.1 hypothetical protein H633G_11563 [Metarhizium anisopliae BRIP 53284]